ncbi:MAG: LamG domain-containing protein [Deltaproteobacteria bacterium]|nr:LamG domain-containing protein [Deltaproteobacteria bacterium]
MSSLWDNIQGKWKLASGAWADTSGNGNTLTASGTVNQIAGFGGGANLAADFAAGPYLYITDAAQVGLDITGAMTISAWFKLDVLNVNQILVAKWNAAPNLAYALFITTANKGQFYVSSNGTATSNIVGSTVLTTGVWYHLVGVYTGSQLQLYLNSVSDATPVTYSSGIYNCNQDFRLGINSGGLYPIDGTIDDVAIWSRALSTTEIGALYNAADDFAVGSLSGTIKNKNGVLVDCSTYNARVNIYPKNNSTATPIFTQLVTASNGQWSQDGLVSGVKYLITFEYEGSYTPTGETDIAGAELLTAA